MIDRDYLPPLRYMGTKYGLRRDLTDLIIGPGRLPERVYDPFCGTGAIASWLAGGPSVSVSDSLMFPVLVARATLLAGGDVSDALESRVMRLAATYASEGEMRFSELVSEEEHALGRDHAALAGLIDGSRHVGNDQHLAAEATAAKSVHGYDLARLYFSRGYFSTRQTIELDSLRRAIDELLPAATQLGAEWGATSPRDSLLARLISVASTVSNSPGHTAQFLRGRTPASQARVARAWSLGVFERFAQAKARVRPRGDELWRRRNLVSHGDALERLRALAPSPDTVVYADPPYTKDQYSRMYHVLETLCLYDYPGSTGLGRMRDARVSSVFCSVKTASAAFHELLQLSAGRGMRVLVSYPSSGLLGEGELMRILSEYGNVVLSKVPLGHSTLGGRRGHGRVAAVEGLYSVTPE